ncbi:MAG: response regulator transcription factor [Halioglobus sp.]|nr:response regulator transcription factor [Halioglobus sp.]
MNVADSGSLLVVDDDDVFREALGRALRRRGFDVTEAATVEAALLVARERSLQFAIVDLKLGSGSGLEVVAGLRSASADTRIVVLTGYASIATAVEAVKLGATNYLTKPATPQEILRALTETAPDPATPLQDNPPSVARLEWEHIQRVLSEHGGNISAAARALNMHRRTLQRKLGRRPVSR